MILCDSEIRAALQHGALIIDPPPLPEQIATSAIDLTLGTEIKRWKVPREGSGISVTIDPSAEGFYPRLAADYLEPAETGRDGAVLIHPREFLLALTHERIELPRRSRLAARVEGRSSLARLGLGVHVTAPTIHSGFRGRITLEITNQGPFPITLRPGLAVCQIIIEQVFGTPSAEMTGIFQDQSSVTGRSSDSPGTV